MRRREFAGTMAGTAAFGLIRAEAGGTSRTLQPGRSPAFRTRFAPYPGLFRHHAGGDYLDQLRFAADAGFRAWQDLGLLGRPSALQEQVGAFLAGRGMTLGPALGFASYHGTPFSYPDEAARSLLRKRMVEIRQFAARTGAKWVHLVPGKMAPWPGERAGRRVVEMLKRCCEILEPAGVVMLLDGRRGWRAYPDCLLRNYFHAREVCEQVGSPSCKRVGLLWDIQFRREFDSTISDGEWAVNAYYEVEPGWNNHDGSLLVSYYRDTFEHMRKKGFQGVIGMEHASAPSGIEAERALLRAYREVDPL